MEGKGICRGYWNIVSVNQTSRCAQTSTKSKNHKRH
ncbi:hypothetical protein T05_12046 [Trichinella murrelli]|uniref:Uncharacterized protein n=1 Tax=Trichinella murrelli TaxID=144512 RepID=A0A0V0SNN8_9BILA|nr:hypothetical protein T05_12046 [Trichinella murrelli]